jgi:hypothetical protein
VANELHDLRIFVSAEKEELDLGNGVQPKPLDESPTNPLLHVRVVDDGHGEALLTGDSPAANALK